MEVSDHCSLVISISTDLAKPHTFRFENFWVLRQGFQSIVTDNWSLHAPHVDKAQNISRKFKNLRAALKVWSSSFSNLKLTIENLSLTILEEYRDLSLEEWNFRDILREKLLSLLEQQRIYWKQRGSVKWVTLGDVVTEFFHANVTIKHRRNLIAKLVTEQGEVVTSHHDKEVQIWHSFKDRLGVTEYNEMLFDLSSLMQEHPNLNWLEDQFTTNEIDEVVKMLPNDKSPGPDGFTNEFIKKCWYTVKMIFMICSGPSKITMPVFRVSIHLSSL